MNKYFLDSFPQLAVRLPFEVDKVFSLFIKYACFIHGSEVCEWVLSMEPSAGRNIN